MRKGTARGKRLGKVGKEKSRTARGCVTWPYANFGMELSGLETWSAFEFPEGDCCHKQKAGLTGPLI